MVNAPTAQDIPDAIVRPRLALWLWERDLDYRAAGTLFGCSHTQVVIICRPFGDPERRRPKDDLLARIVEVTAGEIGSPDFDPPVLRGRWVRVDPSAPANLADARVLAGRAS